MAKEQQSGFAQFKPPVVNKNIYKPSAAKTPVKRPLSRQSVSRSSTRSLMDPFKPTTPSNLPLSKLTGLIGHGGSEVKRNAKTTEREAKNEAAYRRIKSEIDMAFRKIRITDLRQIWDEEELLKP